MARRRLREVGGGFDYVLRLLERGLVKGLMDVVSGHALVVLVMLSAIISFSIRYVNVCYAWVFFVLIVIASFIMLVGVAVRAVRYCYVLAEKIGREALRSGSLAVLFIGLPSILMYLVLLVYSLLFVVEVYGVVVVKLFKGIRPDLSTI